MLAIPRAHRLPSDVLHRDRDHRAPRCPPTASNARHSLAGLSRLSVFGRLDRLRGRQRRRAARPRPDPAIDRPRGSRPRGEHRSSQGGGASCSEWLATDANLEAPTNLSGAMDGAGCMSRGPLARSVVRHWTVPVGGPTASRKARPGSVASGWPCCHPLFVFNSARQIRSAVGSSARMTNMILSAEDMEPSWRAGRRWIETTLPGEY